MKWICLLFQKCFNSKEKCSLILSCSDGQIGFHSGLFKSGISNEKISWLLTIFLLCFFFFFLFLCVVLAVLFLTIASISMPIWLRWGLWVSHLISHDIRWNRSLFKWIACYTTMASCWSLVAWLIGSYKEVYHTLPTFAYSGFFEFVVVLQYSPLIGCICEAVIQSTVRVHASTL